MRRVSIKRMLNRRTDTVREMRRFWKVRFINSRQTVRRAFIWRRFQILVITRLFLKFNQTIAHIIKRALRKFSARIAANVRAE